MPAFFWCFFKLSKEIVDLKEKLEKDILDTNWKPLAEHFARGAVYLLDKELELLDVGVAMAEDDVGRIKTWLDDGLLYPPTPEEATAFSKDSDIYFNMLIVEPYVLIQRKVQG